MKWIIVALTLVILFAGFDQCNGRPQQQQNERFLDLGSLFNRYPYQRPVYGGYPGSNYPGGYPGSNYPGGYGGNGLGTNFLGFGNGGYGGFGGNGGLNSYLGYNTNNYNGQRNLGFGYYRNTDNYGFLPSREVNYGTMGLGYRGYN